MVHVTPDHWPPSEDLDGGALRIDPSAIHFLKAQRHAAPAFRPGAINLRSRYETSHRRIRACAMLAPRVLRIAPNPITRQRRGIATVDFSGTCVDPHHRRGVGFPAAANLENMIPDNGDDLLAIGAVQVFAEFRD